MVNSRFAAVVIYGLKTTMELMNIIIDRSEMMQNKIGCKWKLQWISKQLAENVLNGYINVVIWFLLFFSSSSNIY